MIQFIDYRNQLSRLGAKQIGNIGEGLALKFLKGKGFRLIEKNYHIRGGEIDLIMENDDILLFAEVKTRNSIKFGEPEDAITARKIKKLIRAILHYLHENPSKKSWHCDLIAIKFISRKQAQISQIKDIFKK